MEPELKDKIKNVLIQYTTLDKDIVLLKEELKKRVTMKKELTQDLLTLMETTNVDCFEMGNNAVIHKKRKTRQSLSRKYLKQVFLQHMDDDVYVEKLLDIIMENRNIKHVDTLICKEI
jgi:hypothetical protein